MRGPSWVMESVWRDLPPEVVEKVLTFLPIAPLCRFKTVCKNWNTLISHPDFGSTYSRVSSPEEYVLTTVRRDSVLDPIGWEVLDVANKRCFTLSDAFLTKYVKQEIGESVLRTRFIERVILAADGGLFCVAYSTGREVGSVLFVCNPVLRIVKRLPPLAIGWMFPKVVMSTDRVLLEYEIFAFDVRSDCHDEDRLHIYESKTARWRTAFNLPHEVSPSCTSVFIKNELCSLFLQDDGLQMGILTYDKVVEVWCELGIELPWDDDEDEDDDFGLEPAPAGAAHLVVSGEHLFYVMVDKTCSSLYVFEVNLSGKECVLIAEMPSDLMRWVLHDGMRPDHVEFKFGADIIAVGCGNSILISSCTGRSVACSLSDLTWHKYPVNNLRKALNSHSYNSDILELNNGILELNCGSNHCLSLCAP